MKASIIICKQVVSLHQQILILAYKTFFLQLA